MDKIGNRAVIKYLHMKGLTPTAIHADMVSTLGEDAPSFATVKRWAAEFRRGKESLQDDPRSGRPTTVTTKENVDKICGIILNDPGISARRIANKVGISQERVSNILSNKLGMTESSDASNS
ncbi:protein GVQW3-like [Haliotis rubra]|uniref:protein GVQW3-like n=1 Tax=Haliotis rubra TaxID=36100 RepID=UPI001EE579EE|nr:protein GVQW3-like [Haliotis rubra]